VHLTYDESTLVALLLCSTRVLTWTLLAPPLATAGIPNTIKTVLSVAIGLAVVPVAQAHVPSPEIAPVAGALLEQVVVGASLGFLTRLLFTAVETAGGLLDLFGGFTAAAAYDPMTSATTSIFSKFYGLLCTTLIFATDVHLVIFQGFLRSFRAVPLDAGLSLSQLDQSITSSVTQMFVSALQIAGPLIVVLFLADIALGVLNRIAPQLNAFSMSFPIKIGLTLLLVGTSFMLMPQTIVDIADHATSLVTAIN